MDKELTFYPATGRTRDLVYSEYSSCDRSIHLLIQEGHGVPYESLLKGYRETVSAYLSSANILPPADFLAQVLRRLDELCEEARLPVEQWKNAGIHLLLRCVKTAYVLTTAEQEVLLHFQGRMRPLGELAPDGVDRLRLDSGELQTALFPRRLSDVASVFRIGALRLAGGDIVLGCAHADGAAVLEGLSGPVWMDVLGGADTRAARGSVVSGSVSRKVLVVRFGAGVDDHVRAKVSREAGGRRRIRIPRGRRLVIPAGSVLVAVLIGVLWRSENTGPQRVSSAQVSRPEVAVRKTDGALTPPGSTPGNAPGQQQQIRLTEKWRTRCEKEVTSSPVLLGEAVIFGCRDGNVYALERSTGAQLWKFVATAGVGSSPVVWQDRVIMGDYNGNMFALDGKTGERIWVRKLPARVVSSPEIAGDRIAVGCYDGNTYCLLLSDGSLLWTAKSGARIRGSVAASGDAFFVPSHDGYLYALAAATGKVVWRSGLGGAVSASPAVGDGSVVIGGVDRSIHCFDAASGAGLWRVATGGAVESRALIAGAHAFAGSNDGHLYCVNLADGSLVWKCATDGAVLGRPAVRNGVVYAPSYGGVVYAIELSTGRVLDRFDAGAPVYSSPALDERHVYFGTNKGEFICLASDGEGTT